MLLKRNWFLTLSVPALCSIFTVSAALAQDDSEEATTESAAPSSAQVDPAREEALRKALEEFDKADTNGDGVLTRDEFKPVSADGENNLPPEINKQIDDGLFAMFDADKDGKISKYEHVLMFNKQYDKTDKTGTPSGQDKSDD